MKACVMRAFMPDEGCKHSCRCVSLNASLDRTGKNECHIDCCRFRQKCYRQMVQPARHSQNDVECLVLNSLK